MPNTKDFLRKVPLFADLTESDLEQICEEVEEVRLKAGEFLFQEGDLGRHAYVIREGQIEIFKASNGQKVQLAVRQEGEVIGEISLLVSKTRTASGRALVDSLLLAVGQEVMDILLNSNPSATRKMLNTISSRLQSMELLLRQNEKMAQLGLLSAGIAHELNNPSAAVLRGAQQLKTSLAQLLSLSNRIQQAGFGRDQLDRLDGLVEQARQQASIPLEIDALTFSDREADLEESLEGVGIENSWELAPELVSLGIDGRSIAEMATQFSAEELSLALNWACLTFQIYRLTDEIGQGSSRISEIVKALKSFVYLDQGPVQEVNIHEGLDSTLVILRHKLNLGVEVQKVYDPAVPAIQAYASELNQVWTNLIDNAIDAMHGKGRITLQTSYQNPWVVVVIEDNGPGIPPDVLPHVFSPFFTTKPVGEGTGLGLNISYNIIRKHKGDVRVTSQPGKTRFEVWLPVNFEQVGSAPPWSN